MNNEKLIERIIELYKGKIKIDLADFEELLNTYSKENLVNLLPEEERSQYKVFNYPKMNPQEIKVFKTILKEKIVYLNCSSRDCDGCWAEWSISHTLMGDFWKWLENLYENAVGSTYYEIVPLSETMENCRSYGSWANW